MVNEVILYGLVTDVKEEPAPEGVRYDLQVQVKDEAFVVQYWGKPVRNLETYRQIAVIGMLRVDKKLGVTVKAMTIELIWMKNEMDLMALSTKVRLVGQWREADFPVLRVLNKWNPNEYQTKAKEYLFPLMAISPERLDGKWVQIEGKLCHGSLRGETWIEPKKIEIVDKPKE